MTGEELYRVMHTAFAFDRTWEELNVQAQMNYDEAAKCITGYNLEGRISSLSITEKQAIYEQLYREGCRIYK